MALVLQQFNQDFDCCIPSSFVSWLVALQYAPLPLLPTCPSVPATVRRVKLSLAADLGAI